MDALAWLLIVLFVLFALVLGLVGVQRHRRRGGVIATRRGPQ